MGFFSLLKSSKLPIASGFIVLIILIWVLGPRFGLSMNTRMFAIILILFIAILYLIISQMMANRKSALLEKSIKSQADEQIMSTKPDKREAI